MANNKKEITVEERLERSCRSKMDFIRGLIRDQECAKDRGLCENWLAFLSLSAKHEARARDCLLEQMVRQLRQDGRLSKPFTTHVKSYANLHLLLDEEGRQRFLRFTPPELVAPKPSKNSVFHHRRSRRLSPFVWRQRVQHLNTLEEQYRREEQELWLHDNSVRSHPKEGTAIKEVGVQVELPVLTPRKDRDLLDRARQKQIKERRDQERQRDVDQALHRVAERRQLDLQRQQEVRLLRECRLRERQLKVKEQRDHERDLINKRRESQSPRPTPRRDHRAMMPAQHQKRDKAKEDGVKDERQREVKRLEPAQEARKNAMCQTCHRNLPPVINCERCEVREQQAVLRAENVKQKLMDYENLRQYHRDQAEAERGRLRKERLDQEKAEKRKETDKAKIRSRKDESKLRKEQETQKGRATDVIDRRKEEEDCNRKIVKERDQKEQEKIEQSKNEERVESKQRLKNDLQRKSQKESEKDGETEEQSMDDNWYHFFNLREMRLLQKWIDLQKKYALPAGEISPTQDTDRRKKELGATKEFLKEAEHLNKEIKEKLGSWKNLIPTKSEERLPKDKEEKLAEKSIGENRLSNDRKLKYQSEKMNMQEQPPEDRKLQQSDIKMAVRQEREPKEDLQSCLKKIQKDKDLLTKQVCDLREEIQEQKRLAMAELGVARKRHLSSDSWKKAHENWMQENTIKEKCLQELQHIEAALQKVPHVGEDLTTASWKDEGDGRLPKDKENLPENDRKAKDQTEKGKMEKKSPEDWMESSQESMAELGVARKRHISSDSWKKAHENWMHKDTIKEKCLQELQHIKAVLQKVPHVGEDLTTASLKDEGDGRLPKDKGNLPENDRKAKDQTEKENMEKSPEDWMESSQESESDMAVRRAHEEFLKKLEQICDSAEELKKQRLAREDLFNFSWKQAKENWKRANIIREKCLRELEDVEAAIERIQKAGEDSSVEDEGNGRLSKKECQKHKPLARALGGSDRKRYLFSYSWTKARENCKQANIIREKCLRELDDVEAAVQRIQNAEEDSTSTALEYAGADRRVFYPKETPRDFIRAPKDPPLQAGFRYKDKYKTESKGEKLPQLDKFRFTREVNELVPQPPIKRKDSPSKKFYLRKPAEAEPQRYSGDIVVSYCSATGRKRYPHISEGGTFRKKNHLLHRQRFTQLLAGSRPTEYNPKILTAQNRILQRKLSFAKTSAMNKYIQKTVMLEGRRLVDYLLNEKAKAKPNLDPPRHIFKALIDPLLHGMEAVSPRVLEDISLLDDQMEALLNKFVNCTIERQGAQRDRQHHLNASFEQAVQLWSGMERGQRLVLKLFHDFYNLDPNINKALQIIDKLYRKWKDQRLDLQ